MTQSPLAEDLEFVRQMAEEGASAPSIGGRFAVLWGIVISVALALHWSAFQSWSPVQPEHLLFTWLIPVGIGMAVMFFLGSGLIDKPGASAPGNRAGEAIWSVLGPGFGVLFGGVAVAVYAREQSPMLFNMIMPAAFLAYAGAAGVSAVLFRQKSQWAVALICLAACFGTAALANTSEAYLVAAICVFVTQVIPGLLDLRAEPKAVV